MKYYLIAGETSGDLHASHLMRALKNEDAEAEFRFFGGDLMAAEGGTLVKHYRELAYMGFVPVLLHLPTILRNMSLCKHDIVEWGADVVILVDYPGFNLDIAKYLHKHTSIPVFYYISPKIWAWKEWRIKRIRRDVDEMFCILPFEVPFFEQKHGYPVHYVGNPTANEVKEFLAKYSSRLETESPKDVIALLAGSRLQEVKDNLPAMIEATRDLADRYQVVLAGAPGIERAYYEQLISGTHVQLVENQTYPLLARAVAALVTSGTATLETACFRVPQVVLYKTPLPRLIGFLKRKVLSVSYISLVNLIADREVVRELVADSFTMANIKQSLCSILPGGDARKRMLRDYYEVIRLLGDENAPDNAAKIMVEKLKVKQL